MGDSAVDRRSFLQTAMVGGAAAATLTVPEQSWAQKVGGNFNISSLIDKFKLTDQYDQKIKLSETLKARPYLVVEGFLHCKGQCPRIRGNLGDIRRALEIEAQKLERQNPEKADALRHIPVVWIDVMPNSEDYKPFAPDKKGDKSEPENCVIEAYRQGMWQDPAHAKNFHQKTADERTALAQEAFENGRDQKPEGRLLHVLFPKDRAAAITLQQQMGAHFNAADPQSHGARIALVGGDGKVLAAPSGLVTNQEGKKALVSTIVSAAHRAVDAQLAAESTQRSGGLNRP